MNNNLASLVVAWKEARVPLDRDSGEMAEVERRDGFCLQPLGRGNDGGIDQPEVEGAVANADPPGVRKIVVATPLDRECPFSEIAQKRLLRFRAKVGCHEIVDFRKNRPGKNPRAR